MSFNAPELMPTNCFLIVCGVLQTALLDSPLTCHDFCRNKTRPVNLITSSLVGHFQYIRAVTYQDQLFFDLRHDAAGRLTKLSDQDTSAFPS